VTLDEVRVDLVRRARVFGGLTDDNIVDRYLNRDIAWKGGI